jgi:hypothetical protein
MHMQTQQLPNSNCNMSSMKVALLSKQLLSTSPDPTDLILLILTIIPCAPLRRQSLIQRCFAL